MSEITQSCPTLCDPIAYQAPLSMGFSRQEDWSGLPFPSPGDLPGSGIEHCRQTLYRLSHQGSSLKILKSFKKKNAFFSQFWRLEVPDQGGGRFGFSWGISPGLRRLFKTSKQKERHQGQVVIMQGLQSSCCGPLEAETLCGGGHPVQQRPPLYPPDAYPTPRRDKRSVSWQCPLSPGW